MFVNEPIEALDRSKHKTQLNFIVYQVVKLWRLNLMKPETIIILNARMIQLVQISSN